MAQKSDKIFIANEDHSREEFSGLALFSSISGCDTLHQVPCNQQFLENTAHNQRQMYMAEYMKMDCDSIKYIVESVPTFCPIWIEA